MPNARSSRARGLSRPAALRLAALGILAGAGAACAPDRLPTVPAAPSAPRFTGAPYTGDPSNRDSLSAYLYQSQPNLRRADAYDLSNLPQVTNGSTAACQTVSRILDRLFKSYAGYVLYGQGSDGYGGRDLTFPRPVVQSYVRALSPSCARLAPANGVPNAALDVGGGVGVVTSADGGVIETVPTTSGQAGVRVQPGTFDQDVLLYITPEPSSTTLPTTLQRYAPYYTVAVVPAQPEPFRKRADFGVVVNWVDRAPSDHLVVGHATPTVAGGFETLQPTFLTVPTAYAGSFGGPAYLQPASSGPATSRMEAVAAVGPALVTPVKGTTGTYSGTVDAFSPFGLVSIYQSGVNPNAAVVFNNGECSYGGYGDYGGRPIIRYSVRSANDIVVNFQPLDAANNPLGARQVLYVRGLSNGGSSGGTIPLAYTTARVRFYYGAVLFATKTVPSCSD